MNNEKLRLHASYLLLGDKKTAAFVAVFPKILKLVWLVLLLLGVFKHSLFLSVEYGSFLSVMFAAAVILGFFLIVCIDLLCDRWIFVRSNGKKSSFCDLLISFSVLDFLLSVKLWACSFLQCLFRIALFFLFPSAFFASCLILYSGSVSKLKLTVLVAGCVMLFAVALLFVCVAVGNATAARRLCCFEDERLWEKMKKKTVVLDLSGFKLLGFKCSFYPYFGCRKRIANVIYSRKICSANFN